MRVMWIVGFVTIATTAVLSGQTATRRTASPPHYRGVIDLVLGGPDELRDDFSFSTVAGLYLDELGRIYVGDTRPGNIRRFKPTGALDLVIGRKGDGPGEFRAPCCLTFDQQGHLWIRDWVANRYTAMDLSGRRPRVVTTIRMPIPSGAPLSYPSWDAQGNLMHTALEGLAWRRFFLTPRGDILRAQDLPDPEQRREPHVFIRKVPGKGEVRTEINKPFSGAGFLTFSRNGEFVIGHQDQYRIDWHRVDGQMLRVLRRTISGPDVSAAEKEAAENRLSSIATRLQTTRAMMRLTVPKTKPPLTQVGFDLQGRLWVQLSVPDGQPNRADVYSSAGQLVRTVEWPRHVTLYQFAARNDDAVGVATDPDDLPTIVRIRFIKSPER